MSIIWFLLSIGLILLGNHFLPYNIQPKNVWDLGIILLQFIGFISAIISVIFDIILWIDK